MNEPHELLRRYAETGDEAAFAELVRAKINLVYAAALRQSGGDGHLAEDVTQGVFLALAVQARIVARHPVLTGWLFTTTRNLAAKARRSDSRWRRRETEANAMHVLERAAEPRWDELRPVIDEALHDLPENDRATLLLRYFEGCSLAQVGAAVGVSENGARMRVDRALERLRHSLARRGITSTAAALGTALAAQPVVAAPAALAVSVSGAAHAGAAALAAAGVHGALPLLTTMSTIKLAGAAVAVLGIFAAGALVGTTHDHRTAAASPAPTASEVRQLRAENQRLVAEIKGLRDNLQTPAKAASSSNTASMAGMSFSTAGGGDSGRIAMSGRAGMLPPESIGALSGKWAILADLKKGRVAETRIPLVDSSGNLNEGAAKIFDLTPEEHAAITDAVSRARERIEALERDNATVSRNDKGEYVIAVKPFPEAGGKVYDDLMKSFAQTLGPDRNAAFLSLAADQVDKAFTQFGAVSRTVTVSPASEPNRAMVRDEQVAPGSHSNSTTNFKDRADLLNRIGTIGKLLPPDL